MNWSAAVVAEVPPSVVTVISTVPVPAGAVAVIWLAEMTAKLAALVAPNLTAVAPEKPAPVIVTDVPPAPGPAVGEIDVTVGGATYVYWSATVVADVPPTVVTVTSTVPAAPAGAVAVIEVSELTVKPSAFAAPNFTAVAPKKPVPVIATDVPPAVGPAVGDIDVTVGAATYVYWSAAVLVDVPPAVVTLISTVPVPAGAIAVIEVSELKLKPVASVAPNFTEVTPVKPLPAIVTDVPPAVGPAVGEIDVTVGAAAFAAASEPSNTMATREIRRAV